MVSFRSRGCDNVSLDRRRASRAFRTLPATRSRSRESLFARRCSRERSLLPHRAARARLQSAASAQGRRSHTRTVASTERRNNRCVPNTWAAVPAFPHPAADAGQARYEGAVAHVHRRSQAVRIVVARKDFTRRLLRQFQYTPGIFTTRRFKPPAPAQCVQVARKMLARGFDKKHRGRAAHLYSIERT